MYASLQTQRILACPMRIVLICALFLFAPKHALSAVRYIEPVRTNNVSSEARLEIHGKIQNSDVLEVRNVLSKAIENRADKTKNFPGRPIVILNSAGGDVMAAMQIGRELRKVFAWVIVPSGASCKSACILVLAGGSDRHAYGDELFLGVHRPSFESSYFAKLSPTEAKKKYDSYLNLVASYLQEMGMSEALLKTMMSISSGDMHFLSRESAEAFYLLGVDPAWNEWVRAWQIKMWGLELVQRRDAYIKCLNAGKGNLCIEPDYSPK